MNLNEYENIFSTATESTIDDDIDLGDVDTLSDAESDDEMDTILEALDALDDDEFTATMESMTDDELSVICQVALEASGGSGSGKPKPKHDASDIGLNASDAYRSKMLGNHGNLVNRLSDYLAKKGQASITSDMMKKIKETGEKAGRDDVFHISAAAARGRDKFSKDEALNALKADANARRKKIFNEMKSSGIRNPLAYLAASKQLNTSTVNAYKERADAKYKKEMQRKLKKEAEAEFAKKHPEEAAAIKLKEDRKKTDDKIAGVRKTLSPEEQKLFDAFDSRNLSRGRDDLLANARKNYDTYKSMGYSDKDAKRKAGLDRIEKESNNLIDDRNFRAGIKTAASAFKNTINRDTKSLQNGANKVGKGVKKLGSALVHGAKTMWHDATASTGTELGFDYHDEADIDVLLEAVYEAGGTIYTEALEEVYDVACVINDMDENELDEFMSDMSEMEALEFVECLNYVADVVDADMRRCERIEFESAVEYTFVSDGGYDVITEDVGTEIQNGSSNNTPANQDQNQNQNPTLGQRVVNGVKKFFSPHNQTQGLVQRVGGVIKKAATGVKNYMFGNKPLDKPATPNKPANNSGSSTQTQPADNNAGDG